MDELGKCPKSRNTVQFYDSFFRLEPWSQNEDIDKLPEIQTHRKCDKHCVYEENNTFQKGKLAKMAILKRQTSENNLERALKKYRQSREKLLGSSKQLFRNNSQRTNKLHIYLNNIDKQFNTKKFHQFQQEIPDNHQEFPQPQLSTKNPQSHQTRLLSPRLTSPKPQSPLNLHIGPSPKPPLASTPKNPYLMDRSLLPRKGKGSKNKKYSYEIIRTQPNPIELYREDSEEKRVTALSSANRVQRQKVQRVIKVQRKIYKIISRNKP